MEFASPAAFLLLPLVALLIEPRLGRNAVRFAPTSRLGSLIPSTRITLYRPLMSTVRVIAALLLIVALARPRTGTAFVETDETGRDIILALDLSGSMQAMDFFLDERRVNRLTALQHVVKKFIDRRRGDRMGLIVFGEDAFTQVPLTLDHDVLQQFVDRLEVGIAGQGTAIGTGLAVALKQIKEIPAESKVIVLVTDGKNNSGSISPREAARIAEKLGVKIHAVGIGGAGPAPFPVQGFFGGTTLINRDMEYDEETLRDIAKISGGEYFNAKDLSGLEKVYEEINELEERHERTMQFIQYEEKFMPYLIGGALLLLLAQFFAATFFLKVP